jgi:hypothetical protein
MTAKQPETAKERLAETLAALAAIGFDQGKVLIRKPGLTRAEIKRLVQEYACEHPELVSR